MMDLATTITSAITTVKMLTEFKTKIKDAEFANMLADLNMHLADIKSHLADVMIENVELKQEVAKLQQRSKSSNEMIPKGEAYYTSSGDGPFCIACWDDKQRSIRLKTASHDWLFLGSHECPACKNFYNLK